VSRLAVRRLSSLAPGERDRILARATAAIFDEELRASVGAIVEEVRHDGDAAVARALARDWPKSRAWYRTNSPPVVRSG
jgi:hypothetical protein